MKRRYIIGVVLCISLSLMLFYLTLQFINSAHEISPSLFSINEDVSHRYNITVNNTDAGQSANITQVNIILPNSFIFIKNSNGTNSFSSFTNTSNVLSWTNSIVYVINGGEWKYFWFNATASTPGEYNITIATINVTGLFSSNISIEINDTTPPLINFDSPTPSHNSNLSQSYITAKVEALDNLAIDKIIIYLYNSTDLIDSGISSSSPFSKNFTGLNYGIYYINSTANDTSGNSDFTSTRKITLYVGCVSDWSNCTNWSDCINETRVRTCTDINNCNSSLKTDIMNCTCIPLWQCEWTSKCMENGTRVRTCTDINNCNDTSNKPSEVISCEYKEGININWLFYAIVAVIVFFIIIITRALIKYSRK